MVDDESPSPPVMPSFASLRDPRRRTAVDLLVPAAPAADIGPSLPPRRRPAPPGVVRPVAPRPARDPEPGRPARSVAGFQLRCLRSVLGR